MNRNTVSKRIVIDDRWQGNNIPAPIGQIITDWTKLMTKELANWQYLYYSRSVAITFTYNGQRYELKPAALGLPVDAQAVMEKHQRDFVEALLDAGCIDIMCFGEID